MSGTSACGWRARCNRGTREGTATPRPWLEAGFSMRCLWFHAWAVISLSRWAESLLRPPRKREEFLFKSPSGFCIRGLFRLATSYPFLKKAVDLTHIRGNVPGVDRETYYLLFQRGEFGETTLTKLRRSLRYHRRAPDRLRRVDIPMGDKIRTLHIPTLLDRVVERAVVQVLAVVFEHLFHPCSFGFRPGLAPVHAMAELNRMVSGTGCTVLGKADMKDAFDTIPHNRLLDILGRWINDPDLLALVERHVKRPTWLNKVGLPNIGLPQGGPLSPLLFNVYLNAVLDQRLAREYPGIKFLRWADDILLVCEDLGQLQRHRAVVQQLLWDAGLKLNLRKSEGPGSAANIMRGESIEYLGYRVGHDGKEGLALSLTDDAITGLVSQLQMDLSGQRPNVTWSGYRQFLETQGLYTIGSWLHAYAGGIKRGSWPDLRRGLKGLFTGRPPSILAGIMTDAEHIPLPTPATTDLDRLYDHARGAWDTRYTTPIPDITTRILGPRRDAHARLSIWQSERPEFVADGADLVPAPSVFIEPCENGLKPDAATVEWRVQFSNPA